MKYYVKTPALFTVFIEIDEKNKVKFYRDNFREGGYYIPNGSIGEEIAKIYGEYEDDVWLSKVCSALGMTEKHIKSLSKELNRKWLKKQLNELYREKEQLDLQIKNILSLLEKEK